MNALTTLLNSIATAAAEAVDPVPARVVVAPGDIETWDDCCDGMVWIRIVELSSAGNRGECGPAFSDLICELGVMRCEHGPTDAGDPPSADDVTGDSSQTYDDMDAIRLLLGCEIAGAKPRRWIPVGPSGGCVGGKWEFGLRIIHHTHPVVEPPPEEVPN